MSSEASDPNLLLSGETSQALYGFAYGCGIDLDYGLRGVLTVNNGIQGFASSLWNVNKDQSHVFSTKRCAFAVTASFFLIGYCDVPRICLHPVQNLLRNSSLGSLSVFSNRTLSREVCATKHHSNVYACIMSRTKSSLFTPEPSCMPHAILSCILPGYRTNSRPGPYSVTRRVDAHCSQQYEITTVCFV